VQVIYLLSSNGLLISKPLDEVRALEKLIAVRFFITAGDRKINIDLFSIQHIRTHIILQEQLSPFIQITKLRGH
jgi:hypothetical protein